MAIDFKRKLCSINALMFWKICLQIIFMKNGIRKRYDNNENYKFDSTRTLVYFLFMLNMF